MTALGNLNLLRFFDFYLALAFLVSTMLRIRQYRILLALVRSLPERWPRLLQLVKQHRGVFLTWGTVVPALLAFALLVTNMLACRVVWPHADLTVARLFELWPAVPFVVGFGSAMLAVDVYSTFRVGDVNRTQMEQHFDQAEYWLKSWTAPVVQIFTFGYINPRKIVTLEVRNALINVRQLLNATLWWVSLQTGLRIAFGLSLWLTFAWSRR